MLDLIINPEKKFFHDATHLLEEQAQKVMSELQMYVDNANQYNQSPGMTEITSDPLLQ